MSDSRKVKSSQSDEWRFVHKMNLRNNDEDDVEVITDESEKEASSDEGKETGNEGESTGKSVGFISNNDPVETSYSPDDFGEDDTEDDEMGSNHDSSDPAALFDPSDESDEFLGLKDDDGTNLFETIKTYFLYGVLICVLLAVICSLFVTSFLLLNGNFPENTGNKGNRIPNNAFHELEEALSKLQSALRLNDDTSKTTGSRRAPSQRVLDKLITSVRQIESQISERIDDLAKNKPVRSQNDRNEDEEINVVVVVDSKKVVTDEEGKDKREIPLPPVKDDIHIEDISVVKEPFITIESNTNDDNLQDDTFSDSTTISMDVGRIVQILKNDVLRAQKLIYSQIMSSLFEYKTNAYKNLLRSGLNDYLYSEIVDDENKFESKNVVLLRKLQNLITESSTSHFNWWYEFYFNDVYPKFRDIIVQLELLSEEFAYKAEPFDLAELSNAADNVVNGNEDSDSFFVRATAQREPPQNGGFDWSNLRNKLREIVRNSEVKSDDQYDSKSEPIEGLPNANGSGWDEVFGEGDSGYIESNKEETVDDQKPDGEKAKIIEDDPPNKFEFGNLKKDPTSFNVKDTINFSPDVKRRYRDNGKTNGRHSEGKSNFKNIVHKLKNTAKKAASGFLKLMKRGVKNYEELVDSWRPKKGEDIQKHDLWRSEFLREMKDVLNLVPKNPLVVSLNEFQFKAMQFLKDGIGKMIDDVETPSERTGYCRTHYDSDSAESDSGSENEDCGNVQRYNKPSKRGQNSGWFFELSRHRSKARERLDKVDSWFISSARHRAQMRRQHRAMPFASYHAAPKR